MPSLIKLGVIGYRNHAAKLISIVEKQSIGKIKFIYHPNKSKNDERFTNNFSDLYDCEAVIIASPNHTHFGYMDKLLKNFDGYIFCEKPPVTNLQDLEKLANLELKNKTRLFFNFMLRFGKINGILERYLNSKEIGKTIRIDIIASKGLAFKKEYVGSWRADGKKNLHNILDANSIHFLDLINLHLGKIDESFSFPSLISQHGSSYDTFSLVFKYHDGVILSIFNSYATPLINEISIIGTNGFLTIRDNHITIYSPRDTFDSRGYFVKPLVCYNAPLSFEDDVEYSLKRSMEYFLTHVKEKKSFDFNYFNISMATNRLILKLKNS